MSNLFKFNSQQVKVIREVCEELFNKEIEINYEVLVFSLNEELHVNEDFLYTYCQMLISCWEIGLDF